ncbi:MAG: alpha/beta fold hydrolase [Proteobacteria bacterium]|nr:alpha/beta fold hydrolase [Pseudomonadota bacterium]
MSGHIAIDGVDLTFVDHGLGPAVVFQHGLGGSEAQVAEVFPDADGRWRRLTLDCRGHGRSRPDPEARYGIARFARDVLRLADERQVGRFVAGGISMGAAIALHLAVHHPDRVTALILARPAWLFEAAPPTMAPYAEAGRLMAAHGPEQGPEQARAAFDASETAARLAREAPANLASLREFFTRPDPQATAALLEAVAQDSPGVTRAEAAALAVPTLVIGHGQDFVHPLDYAETLASAIPGAKLVTITPKAADPARHAEDVRAALRGFLTSL